jgi:hypothetical protein
MTARATTTARNHDNAMTQERKPTNPKRFAEPEMIQPNSDPGSTLAFWRAILDTRRPHRTRGAKIETFGIVLLGPALVVIAAVILVALLGYFVMWLCFVGVLFAGTVAADLVHRGWHRVRPFGALDHRALGYPGR